MRCLSSISSFVLFCTHSYLRVRVVIVWASLFFSFCVNVSFVSAVPLWLLLTVGLLGLRSPDLTFLTLSLSLFLASRALLVSYTTAANVSFVSCLKCSCFYFLPSSTALTISLIRFQQISMVSVTCCCLPLCCSILSTSSCFFLSFT